MNIMGGLGKPPGFSEGASLIQLALLGLKD